MSRTAFLRLDPPPATADDQMSAVLRLPETKHGGGSSGEAGGVSPRNRRRNRAEAPADMDGTSGEAGRLGGGGGGGGEFLVPLSAAVNFDLFGRAIAYVWVREVAYV
ncbi:hypothetical protein AXF42_Ash000100 [Apostasia shenzhenica]|uniref:Uncharacterized protein n=1 Tax=Apostasia shenzhenica TaxID=1088818 RepID=A0A2I0AFF6_9ASPA|nr:hypothetical protein AXF42_Ash000100 [Apostasia shenzhenica]